MKFKYTVQRYQTEAVESVVNVFKGQPFNDQITYRRDVEIERDLLNSNESDEDLTIGYANARLELGDEQLRENIRNVQIRNNIKESKSMFLSGLGACSLDVEMETGTGKTYVYIKTIFELNKKYGWGKFIVVVPSVAIREGVYKSFKTTQDHFFEHYGKKARFFIYDSDNLTDIKDFSKNADINVMIINIQAFNSKGLRIRRDEMDNFESSAPIDAIKANHPILILDEPQKMGGKATTESLKEFKPLFCLNYSATHKARHELVYVLDALDAYNERLVKRIEVKGFDIVNLPGTGGYIFLEKILVYNDKAPVARVEFEISYSKGIRRETRLLNVDDDLYALSNNLAQYRGYHISDINAIDATVTFTNGVTLHAGEAVGDVSEENLRRLQIRETIHSHFEKEEFLFKRGIKTLSLFFIDKVSNYRQYDEEGNEINSEYGKIFEEEYNSILDKYLKLYDEPYVNYLKGIDVSKTHAGYFSIDKKGRKIDSPVKRRYVRKGKGEENEQGDVSDDISAYDLILKDKERLLSLDNPVRFIFSHSALREGWDNPNVFQICTLKRGGDSATQKRQEVGRGLRLCVNQDGDRMDQTTLGSEVHSVNLLTVVASDGYKDFVADLQRDIRDDLYERPTKATQEYFTGKNLRIGDNIITISPLQSKHIQHYLIENKYIDIEDRVTDKYREDLANDNLAPLPESCAEIAKGVHALIQGIFNEHALDGIIANGHATELKENSLNANFYKKEFQDLWNSINHKYAYEVKFDTEELIEKAAAVIDSSLKIRKLAYNVTYGKQKEEWDSDKLKSGKGFEDAKPLKPEKIKPKANEVPYDLVGEIAKGSTITRRTAAQILKKINPATFALFRDNPEEFIARTVQIIKEQKATMIVEGITYKQTDGTYESDIFTAEKKTDFTRAFRAQKNVQDYVFTDGYAQDGRSVERRFAEDLDSAEDVCVYAKLPKGFAIPTPVGNYSPDWAIAFHKGTVKYIYFIAETKGSMSSMDLRPIEQAKISCAEKLFKTISTEKIGYGVADSYQSLLDLMESKPPQIHKE